MFLANAMDQRGSPSTYQYHQYPMAFLSCGLKASCLCARQQAGSALQEK